PRQQGDPAGIRFVLAETKPNRRPGVRFVLAETKPNRRPPQLPFVNIRVHHLVSHHGNRYDRDDFSWEALAHHRRGPSTPCVGEHDQLSTSCSAVSWPKRMDDRRFRYLLASPAGPRGLHLEATRSADLRAYRGLDHHRPPEQKWLVR